MGRRITIIIISLIAVSLSLGILFLGCGPMDLRALVEQRVLGEGEGGINNPPVIDAGTYPAYVPNGAALSGTVEDPDGDVLTLTWSEVTTYGVVFGDAEAGDSTISYTGWSDGEAVIAVTLKLTASDGTDDVSAEVTIKMYNTAFVYVTPTGGGDGSAPDNSLNNINEAINYADVSNRIGVAVAEGTYNVDSAISQHVTLVEGVSIFGGFSATNWSRNISANTTTITNSAIIGRTVQSVTGITNATIVDGFTIKAGIGGASSNAGIQIDSNSNPIIQNNAIIGGSSSAASCYGIYIDNNSSPIIRNNTIYGGDSAPSYGIYINSLATWPSNPVIRNNTIDGGSTGVSTYGIYLVDEGNPRIDNNIIFTSSGIGYGIWEGLTSSIPASVSNNNIFDCNGALYYDMHSSNNYKDTETGGNYTMGAGADPMANPTGIANVSTNPFFQSGGNDNLHLGGGTPASILTGGIDGAAAGWGFDTDRDGNPRTGNGSTGWSMGAYEFDP